MPLVRMGSLSCIGIRHAPHSICMHCETLLDCDWALPEASCNTAVMNADTEADAILAAHCVCGDRRFASTFQMLRGTLVLFAGLLTILLLKRRLHSHHWFGMVRGPALRSQFWIWPA